MGPFAALLQFMAAAAQASTSGGVVWRWDQDSPTCSLQQDVGDGMKLEISRTPGNNDTSLTLTQSKSGGGPEKTLNGGMISFEPTGAVVAEVTALEGAGGRRAFYAYSHDQDFLAKFSGATEVAFSYLPNGSTKVLIQSAGGAVGAIRSCEDAKMREWGIDPAAWRSLAVKPIPLTQPRTWMNWLDYPDREKIYKNDIDVIARLDLRSDGSVEGCTIVNQPPAEFKGPTCKSLSRNARLQPARDNSGAPTPSSYVIDVRYAAFLL